MAERVDWAVLVIGVFTLLNTIALIVKSFVAWHTHDCMHSLEQSVTKLHDSVNDTLHRQDLVVQGNTKDILHLVELMATDRADRVAENDERARERTSDREERGKMLDALNSTRLELKQVQNLKVWLESLARHRPHDDT